MRNFIKQTGIISLASIIAFVAWISIQFVYGWTGPTQNPPSGNVPIPIISSRSSAPPLIQDKSLGNLSIGGLFEVALDAIFMENVGIGTDTPTEKLHLDGGNFLETAGNPIIKGTTINSSDFDTVQSISVYNKYAYALSYNVGILHIIDISSSSYPIIKKIYVGSYPTDIFISGKYAYITFQGGPASLKIYDISTPSDPLFIKNYTHPDFDTLWSVKVSGKYAYISNQGDPKLFIIDVSDPYNPYLVGKENEAGSGWVWNLFLSGNYIYIGSDNSLEIYDISNPALPVFKGKVDLLNDAYDIYVSGAYAYVIEKRIGYPGTNSLAIINVANPSSPSLVNRISSTVYATTFMSVYVSGNYAYVSGGNNNLLTIFNISNPLNPYLAGRIIDNTNFAESVFVSGKYAYIGTYDYLTILDISGIDAPTASIGNISASQINVSENMDIRNNLNVGGGLNVGTGGIKTDGDFNVTGTTNTSGGLIIEKRNTTQGDPTINLMDGRIWLRTDL